MPVRNAYFYGKLLDVRHLELEQEYLIEHRRRINRLAIGFGVVCGLEVTVGADGKAICVAPGFALDGLGREIVVPEPICLEDPTQLTDAAGRPAGAATEPVVTLCLAYHECPIEPTPVLVEDCDTREGCAAGAIRERFLLRVHDGPPAGPPYPDIAQSCRYLAARLGGFTGQEGARPSHLALHHGTHTDDDPPPGGFPRCAAPAEECVVLATVTLGAPPSIDAFSHRRVVLSNDHLQEALLCLAAAVQRCCDDRETAGLTLRVVSGDAQHEKEDGTPAEPVVVRVEDADGAPVENQPVTFAITSALGGALDPEQGTTDVHGDAKTTWRLGKAGPQTGEASLAGGTPSVSFTATAEG